MTATDPAAPLRDVKFNTIDFKLTGAFMVAMARQPADLRPTTLRSFMALLGAYARSHGALLMQDAAREAPAPDIVFGPVAGEDFGVSFLPNPGETGDAPLGMWRVAQVLEVWNVREEAAMTLLQNRANAVHIRLPEAGNIAEKEQKALGLQASGETFDAPPYLEPYALGEMTALEFVWSNVGDYTTRSCR
ncbi:MAG: hypothetical protein JNN06_14990 [Gemmobacter sp.]|uniref:hypothetical protein n=1 Tax=Gemmobacter sp. TaxID=1898957 RepID=UPI001A42E6E1|nr:hypothetical protein [Gemmobacter sp.]MBL8563575.1 hypothetical protein [Gemmobacter sp.]